MSSTGLCYTNQVTPTPERQPPKPSQPTNKSQALGTLIAHFVQFGNCIISYGVRATTAATVAPDQPRKISDDLHQGVVGGALAVGKPRHELLTHFAPSTGGFGVVVVAVRQMRVGSVWLSLRLG